MLTRSSVQNPFRRHIATVNAGFTCNKRKYYICAISNFIHIFIEKKFAGRLVCLNVWNESAGDISWIQNGAIIFCSRDAGILESIQISFHTKRYIIFKLIWHDNEMACTCYKGLQYSIFVNIFSGQDLVKPYLHASVCIAKCLTKLKCCQEYIVFFKHILHSMSFPLGNGSELLD